MEMLRAREKTEMLEAMDPTFGNKFGKFGGSTSLLVFSLDPNSRILTSNNTTIPVFVIPAYQPELQDI